MRHYLIFLLFCCITISCNKKIAEKNKTSSDDMSISVMKIFDTWNEDSVKTIKAKSSIDIDSPNLNQSGQCNIKVVRGEKMWASVTKFGFEVARALITRDSIHLINKFDRSYSSESIQYLADKYGLPAEYDQLERLMLGHAPIQEMKDINLIQNEDNLNIQGYGKKIPVFLDYILSKDSYTLNQIKMSTSDSTKVNIEQNDFQDIKNYNFFPYLRKYDITRPDGERYKLKLRFSEVHYDEKINTPFKIPRSYHKVRL